jgi:nitrate reductase NapE component
MRFSGIGVLVVGLGVLWVSAVQAQQVGFTQADRERMVRIETTLQMFMESTNQRFEQVNQRFAERLSFLQIIMGIFTVIMVAAIGFAFWDRPHEHFQSEGNHA